MDLPPYYPINDFGPAMKGIVIGGLGIFHVFLAMFAIGGGMLLCYFEWLGQTGRCPGAKKFVDGYFKAVVLVSFIVGAITGVAMWFTSIQVSPRTIGFMVHEFHWIWAIEWTFFSLEISSGYLFYRYGPKLTDVARLRLLATYAIASWFSLFWINGILSWQLTPGSWGDIGADTHSVWGGFFNAGFFPSLIFRTITAMTVASLAAMVIINLMPLDRAGKTDLINKSAHLLAPMIAMPVLGAWWTATMPADARATLFANIVMLMFLGMAVGSSVLIGLYAYFGLIRQRMYINGPTATLLTVLAFVATAGGEFVREGVRKPFTARAGLYSTSFTQVELDRLRQVGCVTNDPYPLQNADAYPSDQLRLGAKVFRFHCSVCHTYDGANAVLHLAGSWTPDQQRLNIAQLQRTKTFMPPFGGTPEELEALVQLIRWKSDGSPEAWPVSDDEATLAQIQAWLDEVGTRPGIELIHGGGAAEGGH